MRVVIDLQGAQSGSRTRGIGRYSLTFAQAIARNCGNHEVLLALNEAFPETIEPLRRAFHGLVPRNGIRVWCAPGPTRSLDPANEMRRRRAKAIYEAFLASLDPDIVHVTSLFEGYGDDAVTSIGQLALDVPTSVSLYDLIPLHDPDHFLKGPPGLEEWYYGKIADLRRASLRLAISDFVAHDAAARLGADLRIANVLAACSESFQAKSFTADERKSTLARLGIDRPFILTSGTVEPHKNLHRLFKAYADLPTSLRRQRRLVLMGHFLDAHKAMLQSAAAAGGMGKDDLVIIGHVSDDDLVSLYNLCDLMVYPSTDEGFGFPALEAMSCGAPTIASRAASLIEVVGRDDVLFDPLDTKDMTDLMVRASLDEGFRRTIKDHADKHARNFSWDKTAQAALAEMEAVAAEKRESRRGWSSPTEKCLEFIAAKPIGAAEVSALIRALSWSLQRTGARRLFVDVSMLVKYDARTGCQRVTRSILLEWLKNPPAGVEIEPVYATTTAPGYRYARKFASLLTGGRAWGDDEPIDYATGDIFFGLDLELQVVPAQAANLAKLKRRGVEVYFLVYDLLPVLTPHHFARGMEEGFRRWLETIARADGVICISQSTANAFREWLHDSKIATDPAFRIHYSHIGADIENSVPTKGLPEDAPSVQAALEKRPTFLMVGTIEPRKGYSQVLGAFETLWARGQDVNLVFVGRQGWAQDDLITRLSDHPQRGQRFFWLAGISDEYLENVYTWSTCLIAASEGEGFGLPLIEAARHKLPILARDIPVFREVAGEHAAYFSGKEPESVANAVENWLSQHRIEMSPRSDGLAWLTWAESARRTAAILLGSPAGQAEGVSSRIVFRKISGFRRGKQRILLVKLDHMGDFLLAQPAISRLKSRYPNADIDIIVGTWNAALAERLGIFRNIFKFDFFSKESAEAPERREAEFKALLAKLEHYDVAIDMRRQPDTRFVVAKASADLKIGYETGDVRVDSELHIALKHWTDIPFQSTVLNRTHISKQMLALVDAMPRDMDDYVNLPLLVEGGGSPSRRTSIALFPRAGNAIKEWGDENFRELANRLAMIEDVDGVNVYFASTDEAKNAGFYPGGKISIRADLAAPALAESLSRDTICVANNSFGAHLASYVGVVVIGVYGGHETVDEWAPIFGDNYVIHRPTRCSPCHLPNRDACREKLSCFDIPVEYVYRKVIDFLLVKTR
jgi:glycosyltransferase involved in cell wall biosynthesis/ADP-heptose:LPS heptosyltransferase